MIFGFIPPEIWNSFLLAAKYLYIGAPIWLPIVFLVMLFNAWLHFKRSKFWQKQGSVLLEIKLPREIYKSPLAMEIVINSFFHTIGETTWINRYIEGKTRNWFSLEIASTNGKVGFYIWTRPGSRNLIEAQIYSQYPGVEIYEVEDYTKPYSYDPEKNDVWGCEWKLTQPDPYPIKTYIDYGMDKDPKEEFKIDPMTSVIEFLGSLTEGHCAWIQIMIRAHKKEQRKPGTWFGKTDAWKDEAKKQIEEIIEKLKTAKEGGFPRIPTKGEAERIAALERSISKLPFDVGIRSVYIADKDKFYPPNIGGITGAFRQYSSQDLNGFAPNVGMTGFDYPWQDWSGKEREDIKKALVEGYKARHCFFSPYKNDKIFVLNAEELATIYHFPGSVAGTPTFERVPSKKSEAPSNLPL